MKTILLVLAFAASISPMAFRLESPKQDTLGKFAGVWKSLDKENGESLAEITFTKLDNKLTGSVLLRGLIQNSKNLALEFPMTDVGFDGKTLSFKLTMQDKTEKTVTDWEFLLRENNDEARVSILNDNGKPVEDGPVFVMKRIKTN